MAGPILPKTVMSLSRQMYPVCCRHSMASKASEAAATTLTGTDKLLLASIGNTGLVLVVLIDAKLDNSTVTLKSDATGPTGMQRNG